jgi:hypothetical protein
MRKKTIVNVDQIDCDKAKAGYDRVFKKMSDNYHKNEFIRMDNLIKLKKLRAMTKFFTEIELPEN